MNGEFVGEWATSRHGTPLFRYAAAWAEWPRARALSLSLPITADLRVRGEVVDSYFDNLLPDNPDMRRRIRARFGTRSTQAFDLLEAIGRDCVGAVQLLPVGEEPVGWNRVRATQLTEVELEQFLRSVAAPLPLGRDERRDDIEHHDDDFRISIAGAQEKTALLSMGGAWFRPRGATPTTHILKLPLGVVGNFRGDFADSVENEWLCALLMREFGLPIAETAILECGTQTVLAVKRFDRRWIGVDDKTVLQPKFRPRDDMWIARLPQEDFCQATGRPANQKHESDGGPSIEEILEILAGSDTADVDRENFVLAQLAFWMLAATDGHAKNFSLHQGVGGSFGMTPLYDVLSAWPVIGRGPNQLPFQDGKLAMSIRGTSRHYRLKDIQARHWHALALRAGVPELWPRMRSMMETAQANVEIVRGRLPVRFPKRVVHAIAEGVCRQVKTFFSGAAAL
jgi:serine/threonine-protein kinase HipA